MLHSLIFFRSNVLLFAFYTLHICIRTGTDVLSRL